MKESVPLALKYILRMYPHKDELSKARLVKMLYLADWVYAVKTGRPFTGVAWTFNHYGPYVNIFDEDAVRSSGIRLNRTKTVFGADKELVFLDESASLDEAELSEDVRFAIDSVIERTKNLYWEGFLKFIYKTFPVKSSTRYSLLDLEKFADAIKKEGSASSDPAVAELAI
jgi:hypothetical protein